MKNLKLFLLVGSLATFLWGGFTLPAAGAGAAAALWSEPADDKARPRPVMPLDGPLHLRQSGRWVSLTTSGRTTRRPLAELAGALRLPLAAGSLTVRLDPAHPLDLMLHYDSARDTVVIDAAGDLDLLAADLTGALQVTAPGAITVSGPVRLSGKLTAAGRAFDLPPPGAITAAAATLRASETLALRAGRLDIDGDLHLLSGGRLILRDDPTRPLLVSAGGHLQLQADHTVDILALAHPDSALISGGEMRLAAPAPVRGDIHYFSGGAFIIEQPDGRPGHLLSPHDPIVFANGDVTLGDYTGASLHVLAGGSVTLANVTITGPDTGPNSINPGNATPFNGVDPIASLASVLLSNGTVGVINGAITPTLDIRAGIDWATFAGGPPGSQIIPPVINPTFSPASSAAITVTGAISLAAPAGMVLLTNQYRPNNLSGGITTGDIDAGVHQPQTDGGSIAIDSRGDIAVGRVSAAVDVAGQQVTAGHAGNIGLLALNGEIVTSGNLSAFARTAPNSSGSAGNGGFIVAVAANDIRLNNGAGAVDTFAFSNSQGSAGNGGPVGLLTTNGDLSLGPINTIAFSPNGPAGQAGDVFLQADQGAITVAGNAFAAINASSLGGTPGDAGTVTASAGADLTVTAAIRTSVAGPAGNAGDINLFSAAGDIAAADLLASASASQVPGQGGNVIVQALVGAITTGDVSGFSNAFVINNDARDGGDIVMKALGDITTGGLETYSEARGAQGDAGTGGLISLESQGGGITAGGSLQAFSRSAVNNGAAAAAQNGGDVVLQAAAGISISGRIETFSESGIFGGGGGVNATAANGGTMALIAAAGSIVTGGDLLSYTSAERDTGQGGPVTVSAAAGLNFNNGSGVINSSARSTQGSVGNGGPVALNTTAGDISLASINSRADNTFANSPTGSGGDISLATQDGVISLSGNLFGALQSNASGSGLIGDSGDISLTATQGIAVAAGGVTAAAFGIDGAGGDISLLTTGGDISLTGAVAAFAVDSGPPGPAGNITLQTLQGNITTGAITAYSLAFFINNDARAGGAIALHAPNGTIATGLIESYSEARGLVGNTGDGGPVQVLAGGDVTIDGRVATYALSAINNNNSGHAGRGGDIRLQAGGALVIADHIRAFSAATGPNGQAAAAGDVRLAAGGDLELSTIDARAPGAATSGPGGTVEVTSGQFVRATGSIDGVLFNVPSDATISTEGLPHTSAITITHGGGGITPFVVGDAATNGVAAGLDTGDAGLAPLQSFLFDHFEPPNLWILSVPAPELTITKAADPAANAPYRGQISYTVTLSNPGLAPANAVSFTDTLPAEVTFDHFLIEPGGSAVNPGPPDRITWSGSIPAQDAAVFSYVVNHTGNYGEVFSNTAEFFYPPSEQAGTASATVAIAGPPALSIAKSAAPDTDVAYRGQVTYTVTLSNTGPSAAETTLLTDTLPVSATFARWVVQPVGADVVNDEITWAGTVPGNGAVTFSFVVSHTGDYEDVVTNTAEFSHPTTEQTGSASATVTITGPPELAIAKGAVPNTDVAYHGQVTYTVVLSNGANSAAENTLLTDTLPVSATFARWVVQPVGADVSNDVVTWAGTVPGNGAVTFSFVVSHTGDYEDVVTNTVAYQHAAGSGRAEAAFTVEPWLADLLIAKSSVRDDEAGLIVYTITAQNLGPGDAAGSVVADPIPPGLSAFDWRCTPSGGAACTPTGSGPLNDTLTQFPPGGQVTYLITATMAAAHVTVINQATIIPVAGLTNTAPDNSAIDISRPVDRLYLPLLVRDFCGWARPDC